MYFDLRIIGVGFGKKVVMDGGEVEVRIAAKIVLSCDEIGE